METTCVEASNYTSFDGYIFAYPQDDTYLCATTCNDKYYVQSGTSYICTLNCSETNSKNPDYIYVDFSGIEAQKMCTNCENNYETSLLYIVIDDVK